MPFQLFLVKIVKNITRDYLVVKAIFNQYNPLNQSYFKTQLFVIFTFLNISLIIQKLNKNN